ncbi:MAG: glycosyltransferase family 4 protein [bacterium]
MSEGGKPLLILLAQVLPNRVAGLARLAEVMPIEVVDLENDVPHGGGLVPLPDSVPQRRAGLREIPGLIGSGRYRAVMIETQQPASVCLAAWVAHQSGLPLIVWVGLQEVPGTLRWRVGRRILRRVFRWSSAVLSYGEPQSRLAASLGADTVVTSMDPVDLDFWTTPVSMSRGDGLKFLFAGRQEIEKGPHILLDAWRRSGLADQGATLRMIGDGTWSPDGGYPAGISVQQSVAREQMREVYAASDVLVVPSITTRTFKEPWAIVVSEAMCQGVAVVSSDSVGAVLGGLATDGETALVVPEGDAAALAQAMERLAGDEALRLRLAAAGRERVENFKSDIWVADLKKAVEIAVA